MYQSAIHGIREVPRTLTLVSAAYRGRRLPDIGAALVEAFSPIFERYDIVHDAGDQLPLGTYSIGRPRRWLRCRTMHGVHLFQAVRGPEFLDYLTRFGHQVIGFTDMPIAGKNAVIDGTGGYHSRTACVSTGSPSYGRRDSDAYVQRAAALATHELGHNFGLEHHDTAVQSNGGLCPMTEPSAPSSNGALCAGCYDRIGIRDGAFLDIVTLPVLEPGGWRSLTRSISFDR